MAEKTLTNSDLSPVCPSERVTLQEVLESLDGIDIYGLPTTPRGDTVRGLVWALESLLCPAAEPRPEKDDPFNCQLTDEEVTAGRAAINEVFEIASSVLYGLVYLRACGYVNRDGTELAACWSPGDFLMASESAEAALARLKAFNDRLCALSQIRRARNQASDK